MRPEPAPVHDPYAVLRIPDYRLFVASRLCLTLALQIQAVVVGWQIYDLTKDPLSLGLIGLAEAIPSIVVALYAGHLADHTSRKKIIVSCLVLLLVCSAGLLAYTTDLGYYMQEHGVLPIYAVIFLSGIARGFVGPAIFSFMPQLLPDKALYANAVSWNTTLWQTASVAGPALGGLVYGFWGITASYGLDVALTLLATLGFLLIPGRPLPPSEGKLQIKESLMTGLRFVFGNQVILSAISLDLFAVLFGGAVALLPIFAAEVLHTGPQGLGFLRAAPAVGSLLMAVLITHRPVRNHAGRKMLWCVAGFGVCMIVFGLSTSFWLSLLVLGLSGAFDSISVIIRSTLMQLLTPEHLKGRVSSVNNIFVGSSNEIGAFESGVAARLLGPVAAVVFGGCMTLAVVGTTAWKARKLRRLQL
ncbi:MAG: MFS transporter [Adhaeribacter sp.]